MHIDWMTMGAPPPTCTRVTVQEATPAGLALLGPVAQELAGLEGLDAHARAVAVRLAAGAAI